MFWSRSIIFSIFSKFWHEPGHQWRSAWLELWLERIGLIAQSSRWTWIILLVNHCCLTRFSPVFQLERGHYRCSFWNPLKDWTLILTHFWQFLERNIKVFCGTIYVVFETPWWGLEVTSMCVLKPNLEVRINDSWLVKATIF